jgi:2-polyprenyl-3-methyl-5-hydroxy-6-metoxy-1,4-benzoquinol methylase
VLTGEFRNLLSFAGDEPILDIGCGDGDLSFYLESLGYDVTAVDYAPSNFNAMRGVQYMKDALGSRVGIHSINLDSETLPAGNVGLVFLLGVMYHLKNPLGLLDQLSQRARYCVLSTRVMQLTPNRHFLRNTPVAYLVDRDELNQDETNFWIFTEAGFRRMLDRAHWEVLDLAVVGEETWSDPRSLASDARLFCLVRSRNRTDPTVGAGRIEGWHELEDGRWRWTERRFSAALRMPQSLEDSAVKLRFVIPQELLAQNGVVTLAAQVNGCRLPERTYGRPGEFLYREALPAETGAGSTVRVQFELSHAVAPHGDDERELGVCVAAIGIEPLGAESTGEAEVDHQIAHLEQRVLEYAAQIREAARRFDDRSDWARELEAEVERRGKELVECVDLLVQAEKTAADRTQWALKLQRDLHEQTKELLESNRLLRLSQESAESYHKRSIDLQHALDLLDCSRWMRLGKLLGFPRRRS